MNHKKTSHTCAAASLTGHASNVTGAAWTITGASAGDGLAHLVTIKNDSVTDHSAKTIVLVGKDLIGNALTETLAAPGTSATVTSTKYFASLSSATPSATIGTDTFDIGWSAVAVSPWLAAASSVSSVAVTVGGTINFDVQQAFDTDFNGVVGVQHATVAGKTADTYSALTIPVAGARVKVNSHTAGTFVLHILS